MKSIRLSLIVYFLVLLVAAEGAAFLLVYRSAAIALREKQVINRQLLDAQYSDRRAETEKQFDVELDEKARDVAHLAFRGWHWYRLRLTTFFPLVQMLDVQPHLSLPFYFLEGTEASLRDNPLRFRVMNRIQTSIEVPEDYLPKRHDGEVEYFQINCEWLANRPWMSRSLQTIETEPLPFDKDQFSPAEQVELRHDDLERNGRKLRRVMYKLIASPRGMFLRPPPGARGAQPPGPPHGGPQPRGQNRVFDRPPAGFDRGPDHPPELPGPWMVVHVARDRAPLDARLNSLEVEKQAELDTHDQLAQESLTWLRRQLFAIIAGTVIAMLVGGLILGGYGLAPLRHLSDAVSRVSASDFRLPLAADEKLPSELAPIRERLEHTLGELRKAFEREKQASADISHELRTPVASLLTTVEVALKKQRTAEEYRKTLDECRTIGRQMRQLVERIMALARLDAGSDRVRPRPVDVSEVVAESAALVRPLAVERGLELRVHCPKPVTVTTDPDKLREVLVNLLHNAVQYNTPHGSVDVAAETHNGWLDLCVHDTGIGIEPGVSEQIFERFYRVDASRHADDLHAGLGLSIVKGYVGLLGGTISVESQPGQGSTFRVRLPAA
jgi:two-component system, OmpR family, heavy metal sensor histidine kinase CusS